MQSSAGRLAAEGPGHDSDRGVLADPGQLGFRRGEIVGLRWENVDLEKRKIRVRTQRPRVGGEACEDGPKGKRRRQTLPLPGICVAPLHWQRMKQAGARARAGEKWEEVGYVFTTRTGWPIEPRNVYRSFTRVAKDARPRVIRLHDARHGTATLLIAAGVPPRVVMEILGHSQIDVTMNVHAHVVQDTKRGRRTRSAPVAVRSGCKRPPAMIGGGPSCWWARTVSNRRHLLCKSSALPLSYAPVDEWTAYMQGTPPTQTRSRGGEWTGAGELRTDRVRERRL